MVINHHYLLIRGRGDHTQMQDTFFKVFLRGSLELKMYTYTKTAPGGTLSSQFSSSEKGGAPKNVS